MEHLLGVSDFHFSLWMVSFQVLPQQTCHEVEQESLHQPISSFLAVLSRSQIKNKNWQVFTQILLSFALSATFHKQSTQRIADSFSLLEYTISHILDTLSVKQLPKPNLYPILRSNIRWYHHQTLPFLYWKSGNARLLN